METTASAEKRAGASLAFYQSLRLVFCLIAAIRCTIIFFEAFGIYPPPQKMWVLLSSLVFMLLGFSIGWWSLSINIYNARHRRASDGK